MIDLKAFFRSLEYAVRGVARVARTEQNFRIELAVGALVVLAMYALGVTAAEKGVLLIAITLVLVLELSNSIAERTVDLLKPRIHHYVEEIKDIMAGAVLVASAGAVAIGFVIFWPYLVRLFSGL